MRLRNDYQFVGPLVGDVKSVANSHLESCISNSPAIPVRALVLQKLTPYIRSTMTHLTQCKHLRESLLADTFVDNREPIQLLTGHEVYESILRCGMKAAPRAGHPHRSHDFRIGFIGTTRG